MTKCIAVAVAFLALALGVWWFANPSTVAAGYDDVAIVMSGEAVQLADGVGETESVMGSAGKSSVRYFGNETFTDLDGDGREDVVFLITQETGGSGTFFYAVGALNTIDGYVGTHAVLIGDRIAPQTVEARPDGTIVVNYADRKPGEPMTVKPSVGKSLYLKYDAASKQFGEHVQDFEGETACNGDAKICPDGSSVGRTGPTCEFAACPSPERTEATLTTYLGGSPTAMNVTLQPKQVVSDSRCPQGVQCIWAGTVEVRTVMSTQVAHGEQTLKLGEPARFGDFSVTLTEVTPYPKEGESIPESSYRFTFTIER